LNLPTSQQSCHNYSLLPQEQVPEDNCLMCTYCILLASHFASSERQYILKTLGRSAFAWPRMRRPIAPPPSPLPPRSLLRNTELVDSLLDNKRSYPGQQSQTSVDLTVGVKRLACASCSLTLFYAVPTRPSNHEETVQVNLTLRKQRGKETAFFAFADTVTAKAFNRENECHGWLGIKYQDRPQQ